MSNAERSAELLIGTTSKSEAFGVVATSSGVEFESDPLRLLERADERAFDVIVLDAAMAWIQSKILERGQSPTVLITSESRLLSAVNEAAASAPDGNAVAWEIISQLFLSLRSSKSVHSKEKTAFPEQWLGTLVSRKRSTDEETSLRNRALSAAFEERRKLLEDSLSTQQVATLLGSTRQTPHDRVRSKTLLAIEDNGQLRFPPWQFDPNGPNGVIAGLPDVLRALALGPVAQARWLTRVNAVLENEPLAALKSGKAEQVIREARAVAAQAGSIG